MVSSRSLRIEHDIVVALRDIGVHRSFSLLDTVSIQRGTRWQRGGSREPTLVLQ